jgi:hypothetical protein
MPPAAASVSTTELLSSSDPASVNACAVDSTGEGETVLTVLWQDARPAAMPKAVTEAIIRLSLPKTCLFFLLFSISPYSLTLKNVTIMVVPILTSLLYRSLPQPRGLQRLWHTSLLYYVFNHHERTNNTRICRTAILYGVQMYVVQMYVVQMYGIQSRWHIIHIFFYILNI